MSRSLVRTLRSVVTGALLAVMAVGAHAQASFPSKPVRMIIPAPPGSGPDALGRILGNRLSEAWGQPVVIENVVGAGGAIGHERGARAAPDGHTLLMGLIGPMSVTVHFGEKMTYDPVKDLAPVKLLLKLANLLVVHPSVPAKNLSELIAYAKANPDKLRYGHPGSGTSNHLSAEQFNLMAGVKTSPVPYRASSQMTTDLIGGHIDIMFHNLPVVLPHVKTGAMRALAITSAQRNPAAPDIPTVAELGVQGYEVTPWYGMYVPAGTPRSVIDRLNADIGKALGTTEVTTWISAQGGEPGGGTPEQLAAFQAAETAKWGALVRAANIKPQ